MGNTWCWSQRGWPYVSDFKLAWAQGASLLEQSQGLSLLGVTLLSPEEGTPCNMLGLQPNWSNALIPSWWWQQLWGLSRGHGLTMRGVAGIVPCAQHSCLAGNGFKWLAEIWQALCPSQSALLGNCFKRETDLGETWTTSAFWVTRLPAREQPGSAFTSRVTLDSCLIHEAKIPCR